MKSCGIMPLIRAAGHACASLALSAIVSKRMQQNVIPFCLATTRHAFTSVCTPKFIQSLLIIASEVNEGPELCGSPHRSATDGRPRARESTGAFCQARLDRMRRCFCGQPSWFLSRRRRRPGRASRALVDVAFGGGPGCSGGGIRFPSSAAEHQATSATCCAGPSACRPGFAATVA